MTKTVLLLLVCVTVLPLPAAAQNGWTDNGAVVSTARQVEIKNDVAGRYDATLLTLGHAEPARYQSRLRMLSTDGRPRLILGTMQNGTNYEPLSLWENRVGINILSPAAPLDVHGAASGTGRALARIADDSSVAQGVGAGLDLAGIFVDWGGIAAFGNLRAVKANGTNGDAGGNLILSASRADAQLVEVARFAPGSMAFTGDATFTGTVTGADIQARYQDVAEWVPAAGELTPGMVVVLDAGAVNQVMASRTPYDTTVAGVVSARPGLILGERAEGREMIATTGRVKVRVDATAHPIAVGDLLVTSGKPGMAMRSAPLDLAGTKLHRPGTIIGKALEPLARGEGEILVLLSMQ